MNKIIIIYNQPDKNQANEQIRIADEETGEGAKKIFKSLKKKFMDTSLVVIDKETIKEQISKLDHKALIFNYCEWTGINMPYLMKTLEILEKEKFIFTGCSFRQHQKLLDKKNMKQTLVDLGVKTLNYVFVDGNITAPDLENIKYPAIVKLTLEHCSIGLANDSLVFDSPSTIKKVQELYDHYHQAILVEEFAEGNEYHVYAFTTDAGIQTLPVYQTIYKKGNKPMLVTFDDNWHDKNGSYGNKVAKTGVMADHLKEKEIQKIGLNVFSGLGERGYIRLDIREKNGQPYVLDINPNPSLAWTDEYNIISISATAAGMSFDQIIWWPFEGALKDLSG